MKVFQTISIRFSYGCSCDPKLYFYLIGVFYCCCVYCRVSSGGVNRTTPRTLVPVSATVWLTERTATGASTVGYKSAWLWACPGMVSHVILFHTNKFACSVSKPIVSSILHPGKMLRLGLRYNCMNSLRRMQSRHALKKMDSFKYANGKIRKHTSSSLFIYFTEILSYCYTKLKSWPISSQAVLK